MRTRRERLKRPQSRQRTTRRTSIAALVWRALAVALVAIVCGRIPASVALVEVVYERSAPPLPPDDASARDASIDVRARDEKGAPLFGVRVRVLALRDEADGRRAYAAGEGTAGPDGHVRLLRLPRGEAWITADAEGRARASSAVVLEQGDRLVELVLEAGHRLDVEVKDERGEAIAGAEIEAAQADPLPIGARTGADGVAHVTRLGAPPWTVTARAKGFDEVTTHGAREGEPMRMVLHKLGAIAVHVVDEHGAGVAGARVQIASPSLWPARSAECDASGAVRIGALPAGTYALRATSGDLASPIELGTELARGEEANVTLRLAASVTVAVRVVGDDDAPVFGARVTLAESGISPFPVEATTDREGRARLGPVARGAASVAVRAESFVARELAVPDPLPAEVRIALAHAGTIEGRVVDARGFPIDGATIEIAGTAFDGAPIDDDPRRTRFTDAQFASALAGPRPLVAAGELGVMPGPVPSIPAAGATVAGMPPTVGTTDEPWVTRKDGTYRASPASPGRVRVLVHHPQYVDASSDAVSLAPGGTVMLDVVMHAGGILEGRVVDAGGGGVQGARVVLAAAHGSMERMARTASDGSFGFAAVPTDVVLLVSPDDEGSNVELRAHVAIPEGGHKSITLQLGPARDPLPVRVRDDRGYPVEGAQVTVVSLDSTSALRETSFTDGHGETVLPHAKGIALRAEVRADDLAPSVMRIEPSANAVEVTLARAESAAGEVRSTRGDPIADAEVTLYTDLGARKCRTSADGAFTLAELAAGHARVVVRASGFARASREVNVDANAGRRPTTFERIELIPGGSAEGVVLDARGDPVIGARVAVDLVPTYLAVGATPPGVAVTDARGRFRLDDLAEGALTLEAFSPDLGRARQDTHVFAGEVTHEVRFVLRGGATAGPHSAGEPRAAGSVAITLGETGDPREVVVVAVAEGSEAERAGLAPGDAIVSIEGAAVTTMEDARAKLSGPLGDDVLLTVHRGDHEESLRVAREPVRR